MISNQSTNFKTVASLSERFRLKLLMAPTLELEFTFSFTTVRFYYRLDCENFLANPKRNLEEWQSA